jgi:nitrite reductase/ring-hydroxylating ferredoxin subunit
MSIDVNEVLDADTEAGDSDVEQVEDDAASLDGYGATKVSPTEMREWIPAEGLKEYWYPAIADRKVRGKPVYVKLLGTELVLFRGSDGQVAALTNVCPHRGGFLASGACNFQGTVSCPYHGWTFDKEGDCVAVLGEGPTSRLAGMRSARARKYPTQTLKGMVFVWMGDKKPADIREDVPEHFFNDDIFVQNSVAVWKSNWRPAVENIFDAHVYYVHRNSLRVLLFPTAALLGLVKMGPRRPHPHVVNKRGLVYRNEDRPTRRAQPEKTKYQDVYPSLGGQKWPTDGVRYYWSRLMTFAVRFWPKHKTPMIQELEWNGAHLPATFQVDYFGYLFTRITVPIDKDTSRIFYFHAKRRGSWPQKVWDVLYFKSFHNWYMNYNFSGQDGFVVERQYYDRPEKLSATDVFPIALRRLIYEHGRGMDEIRAAGVKRGN